MTAGARWETVLDLLAGALPDEGRLILVDGAGDRAALVADRLAGRFRAEGRTCARLTGDACTSAADGSRARAAGTIVIASGPRWRDHVPAGAWHLTIWVRTSPDHAGDHSDAVVDLLDPGWPVIRHLDPWLVPDEGWHRSEPRAARSVPLGGRDR
ncbi:hypothetical protein ACQPZX_13670 [Actinoplanes sp. CA-142083]|uniref:hypothetical protein n=1 Tax=Actinoplanes sp. CA-142083 TaxID=3239903 RepID=UPI003D8F99C4